MAATSFAEKARANAQRIRKEYNASHGSNDQTSYMVETQGLHNIWLTSGNWHFKSLEDARRYASNELKPTEKKRIVEWTWVNTHEVNTRVIEEV